MLLWARTVLAAPCARDPERKAGFEVKDYLRGCCSWVEGKSNPQRGTSICVIQRILIDYSQVLSQSKIDKWGKSLFQMKILWWSCRSWASSMCQTWCINASRSKWGRSKKRLLNKKRKLNYGEIYKFCENRGEFINFVEIGGICNMHHWLRGLGRLVAGRQSDDNGDGVERSDSYETITLMPCVGIKSAIGCLANVVCPKCAFVWDWPSRYICHCYHYQT